MKKKTALIIAGVSVALFGVYLFTRHRKAKQIQSNMTSIANDPNANAKVAAPNAGMSTIDPSEWFGHVL